MLLVAVACAHNEEREDYPTRSMMPNDTTDTDSSFTFRADTAWKDTIHIKFKKPMKPIYTIKMSLHYLELWLYGDERLKGKDLWEVWCRDWRPYRHKRQLYHKRKQFR